MTVYVVRTDYGYGVPVNGVFERLEDGQARIGWSSDDCQDLSVIAEAIENDIELNSEQREARRCLRFYRDVTIGDYLIYPHQPERYMFCVARVTGDYEYLAEANGIEGDFRSSRSCELITNPAINYDDVIVPPIVQTQLGLPGRFYEMTEDVLFQEMCDQIYQAGNDVDTSFARYNRIRNSLTEQLPAFIYREFPRAHLSRQFCRDLFTCMGYSEVKVQEGPNEAGSDVVVIVGDSLLPVAFTVGVQVFCYRGQVEVEEVELKLNQLIDGWDNNGLDYGVLLTTGNCEGEELKNLILDHNRNHLDKKVKLIDGRELAELFMKHMSTFDG